MLEKRAWYRNCTRGLRGLSRKKYYIRHCNFKELRPTEPLTPRRDGENSMHACGAGETAMAMHGDRIIILSQARSHSESRRSVSIRPPPPRTTSGGIVSPFPPPHPPGASSKKRRRASVSKPARIPPLSPRRHLLRPASRLLGVSYEATEPNARRSIAPSLEGGGFPAVRP